MTQIVTVADSAASATRSQRHTVLEAGNMSFPKGRYTVDVIPDEGRASCRLEHAVEHAAFIDRLIDERAARYCCTVSAPVSSYRRIHFSYEASQKIEWNPEDLGEPPLFTPMVVASEAFTVRLCSERDDVHPLWDRQTVEIEKGCRLAVGPVIRIRRTLLHLLRFDRDPELAEGRFRVDAESQPFQFVVTLSADLHRFLQHGKGDVAWRHIMTHVVTACFALLQKDFSSTDELDQDEGLGDRNLDALADYLERKGLPHWEDTESFRPEVAATELYPHLLGDSSGT